MIAEELKQQIESAYDFRGHVSVVLKGSGIVEGFLFNRDLEKGFVELYLKGGAEHRRLEIAQIASIALTGEDCAAGKSYEDYQKKKAAEKKA